ncbi:hypothetical protein Q5424_01305 [Conexibacter sp. JD483]|uniref:hypothetical protein n=1 Tax=unclassified Conexibacter TaxID=2627773 RepID=UPI00272826D5|nr:MULTISPECIES: hypothetical protein [unclassified Conexibacter]MDO8185867.1 hypothetical protein [Conexibacter sp. CPCC 205706]MDO8198610.1 hypothetical protein [Conexibacter sp. CPCC 205762]MDR9367696.1 hypothetical protein [Conexibacter sp. JD483]
MLALGIVAPAATPGGLRLDVIAPVAHAATYQVRACQAASEYGFANRSWVATNTAPTFFEASTTCPTSGGQNGGIHVGEQLGIVGFTPLGTGASVRFTAPAGTTIIGLSYARYLGQWSDNSKVPALLDDTGNIVAGETCTFDAWASECALGSSSPSAAHRTITGLTTQTLTAGISCQAAPPATGCGGSTRYGMNSWFSIYASTVTISQSTAPNIAASSIPSAWTRTLPGPNVSSGDPSGVRHLRLYVDGSRVVDEELPCDFSRPAPCDNITARPVPDPTISDGTHSVVAATTNAAGLEARASAQTVRIDRTAPTPPTELRTDTGTDWQTNGSTTARWTLPVEADAAPITTATVRVCEQATGICDSPRAAATLNSTSIDLPHEGTFTVSVWLGDAAGNTDETRAATTVIRYTTTPPAPPMGLTSDVGSDWQNRSSATILWTPPETSGAPVNDAYLQRCGISGCSAPTLVGSTTTATVAFPNDGIFTVRVWLKNAAGLASPAAASETTLRLDTTPPAAPTGLTLDLSGAPSQPLVHAVWSGPPADGGSPLSTSRWTLCKSTACVSGTTADNSVIAAVPGAGEWTFSVRVSDAAGNIGPATSATFASTPTQAPPDRPGDGPDDDPDGSGERPSSRRPATKASADLRITRLRAVKGVLELRLNATSRLTARATITVRATSPRSLPPIRRRAQLRAGRATLRITLRRGTRRGSVTITTPSTATVQSGKTTSAFKAISTSATRTR